MEESEFELGEFHLHENHRFFNPREQEEDRHEDHGDRLSEDNETVVKIEESGDAGPFSAGPLSAEPSFSVPAQHYESDMATFKSEIVPSMMTFSGIPGPSAHPQIQVPGNSGLVPMYEGVVKLSFGREIILGPSKKFGTKNQTSYRIVTLSKYECDVCQFSYVGENVNVLKGHNKTKHECEICGDRFEYSILQKHKGSHVQDSFECVICYKRFPGAGDLNQFRCQNHLNINPDQLTFDQNHAVSAIQTQTSNMAPNFQLLNMTPNEPQTKKLKLQRDPTEETDFYIPNQEDSFSIPSSSSSVLFSSTSDSPPKRKQPKASNAPKPIHKCAFCDFVTVTQKSFEEHHRENHKNEDVNKQTKILSCKECNFQCTFHYQLATHRRQHRERSFKCEICSAQYWTGIALKNHKKTHTGEMSFKCNFCDYATYRKTLLQSHQRCHSEDRPYGCVVCEKKFKTKDVLNSHVKTHEKNRVIQKNYHCDLCDYKAKYPSLLEKHMDVHTGAKPLKCRFCDYSTREKTTLQNHESREHTGERPYKCDFTECDYTGATSANLSAHKRNIHGGKHQKCPHQGCDYQTKRNERLVVHIRSHTGERPYKCDQCEYAAITSGNLREHYRTHTGEKPFKCPHCDYACRARGNLNNHIKNKHSS